MRFEYKEIQPAGKAAIWGPDYIFRFYIPTDELLPDEITNDDLAYAYALDQVKKQVNDYCNGHLMPGTMLNLEKLELHFEPNESYATYRSCCNLFMPGTVEENIKQVKNDLDRFCRELNSLDIAGYYYSDRAEELHDAIWCCNQWLRRNGIN